VRIVFAGTPATAEPALAALLTSVHEVVAVITQPPAMSGRGRKLVESAVSIAATAAGIPVLTPSNINDAEFLEQLQALNFDGAAIVAYGQLLKAPVLQVPQFGWVNLHFSLLPAWRGAAPVQRAIMAGDSVTGTSTFILDEGMDTGLVCGQTTTAIRNNETAGELLQRLSINGAQLLVDTISALETGEMSAQPQSGDVSHAPKLSVAEANIKWHHPALGIDRWIRGCTPSPGAWTTFQGSRLGIGPVQLVEESILKPGYLSATKNSVEVGTGSQQVRLGMVQPAGKGWMTAADWVRGVRGDIEKFDYVTS